MIYFDNSATTLQKPPEVAQAVARAIQKFGNPGRSFCDPAMEAARAVFQARSEIAKLAKLENPLNIAFTSGSTESLNLVLNSLVSSSDNVITSVLEHNSVLRPLYKIGCQLSFIECDDEGNLILNKLDKLLKKNTRYVICTHGSNLTGTITDVGCLSDFCKKNGLIFILDVSQTLGSIETLGNMADILCFTGHKALFGPQGTGGVITNMKSGFNLVKTGGSGSNSFALNQSLEMPDIFEAGTHNAHGLAGLQKGVEYINRLGVDTIAEKENYLIRIFLRGISDIPSVRLYGPGFNAGGKRLPIAALNIGDLPAEDVAYQLWEKWRIATRAGSHCAPLVHKHFKTQEQGMVRFSFSVFNTQEEIYLAISALHEVALMLR